MRLLNFLFGLVITILAPFWASAQNIGTEVFNHDIFTVATYSPPGLMWIEDSQHRRAGVNPSYELDKYGILEDKSGLLNEIPNCSPEWDNEEDPTRNHQPHPTTYWLITVNDAQGQTYIVHIKGITDGIQLIHVVDDNTGGEVQPRTSQRYSFLVTSDSMKEIAVSVDSNYSFSTTRIVGNDDLLDDVKSACHQDLIKGEVCKRLEKKAEAIGDDLKKKNKEEAKRLIKSFLCNLGKLKGYGDDDQDCHAGIKEPALDILIADAEALRDSLK